MKTPVKIFILFIKIAFNAGVAVLCAFHEEVGLASVIIVAIFAAILTFLSISKYTTKKKWSFLYNHDFIGKYTAELEFRTYAETKKQFFKNGDAAHEVVFELLREGDSIVKKQSTVSVSNSESKSKLVTYQVKSGIIYMTFKYEQNADYPKVLETKTGYEVLEWDIKKKLVVNNEYFNSKPGFGKLLNIKKKNSD